MEKSALKAAVTKVSPFMVMLHASTPVQALLHPEKYPDRADSVRLTVVPVAKLAEQFVPQLMPLGLLVTVPFPLPAGSTHKRWVVAVEPPAITLT